MKINIDIRPSFKDLIEEIEARAEAASEALYELRLEGSAFDKAELEKLTDALHAAISGYKQALTCLREVPRNMR